MWQTNNSPINCVRDAEDTETNSHVTKCSVYSDLLIGRDLGNDMDLVQFFRDIMARWEENRNKTTVCITRSSGCSAPFLLAPAEGSGALQAPCCTPNHSTHPYLAKKIWPKKVLLFLIWCLWTPAQPTPPPSPLHPTPHYPTLPHPTPPNGHQFGCVTIDIINLRSFYSPLDALQPNKFMKNVLP